MFFYILTDNEMDGDSLVKQARPRQFEQKVGVRMKLYKASEENISIFC